MTPDLVIFDCDGVLIDSEILSAEVLIDLAARHGVALTHAHVRDHFVGRSFPTVAQNIRESFAVDLPPGFEAAYRAELLARFETDLRPMPGIFDILARLKVARACATSSSPQRAARSLAITGLDRWFPRVFTASEVARGKPAPDLFLHAAACSGAAPSRCLVIEDSRPGIAAARAAGMDAILFTGGSHMGGKGFDSAPPVAACDRWAAFPALCPALFQDPS